MLFSRARRINGSMDSADEEGLGRVMRPSNQRQGAEESLGQGEYDESQARQSFQDALREWRSAGKRGNDGEWRPRDWRIWESVQCLGKEAKSESGVSV